MRNYMRREKEPSEKTAGNNAPELHRKENSFFSTNESEKPHNS